MMKENKREEKICLFFASDYHFEMISLPYIEKNLEKNNKVIILTENNLEDTIEKLVSKVNLSEEKKKKILNLNWKQDDLNKFKEIKEYSQNKQETVIFIKGKENYIKNINENIEKWTKENEKIKIIDCYEIDENTVRSGNIINNYSKILSTSGEKRITNV